MRRTSFLAFAACVLLLASSASAQSPSPPVEVLGLKNWTVQMIRDSLAVHAPGTTLESHACAAALREKLGFADASVTQFSMDGRQSVVVTVIEPGDSARVRYRPAPTDSLAPPPGWSGAIYVLRTKPWEFEAAVNSFAAYRESQAVPAWVRDTASVQTVLTFLDSHRSEADRTLAMKTLRDDASEQHRAVAALLLMNFGEHDETWWALADALGDTGPPVKTTAENALQALMNDVPRKVDWAPAAGSVQALLDGTNLFAFYTVIRALVATDIDAALAGRLLPRDGGMALHYLAATTPGLADDAHRLLVVATGQDFGLDRDRWREWLARR